jgi:hypothetical protein
LKLSADNNIDIQHEALWCISNTITCSSQELVRDLILIGKDRLIENLLAGLSLKDNKLLANICQALLILLKTDRTSINDMSVW